MRVFGLAEDFVGRVYVDGFALNPGDIPQSYAHSHPGKPSQALWGIDTKGFRDSPILGVGPQKSVVIAAVDNEYLRYATRYGIVGLSLYMMVYLLPFAMGLYLYRKLGLGPGLALAVAVQGIVVAFLLFNISAGTFYQPQVMAVFSVLVGLLVAVGADLLPKVKGVIKLDFKLRPPP